MSELSKLKRVPYNPRLRELVKGKRRGSSSAQTRLKQAKLGFRGWHERGYLPHCDKPGLTQFVTFHLADSFPSALRSEWEHFAKVEDDRERRIALEAYLDRGRGECYLRRPEIAELVECNFREFAGDRYQLRAWCIMPNHVHVLFKVGTASMSETIHAWKKHTGRLANEVLGKRGAFWAQDFFDTFMRDSDHQRRTIRYIENNPTKAKLVRDSKDWSWSSARFRDEFGELKA